MKSSDTPSFRNPLPSNESPPSGRENREKSRVRDLAHVCLATTDLEAAETFYCEGLGFEKAFDFVRAGKRVGFYLRVGSGRFLEIFLRDSVRVRADHPLMHMCFEVEDIDALYNHLVSLGIQATVKKLGADRSWQVWSTDPDGMRIEFHQYTGESSQVTGQTCELA